MWVAAAARRHEEEAARKRQESQHSSRPRQPFWGRRRNERRPFDKNYGRRVCQADAHGNAARAGMLAEVANFVFGAEGDASFSFITGKVDNLPPFIPRRTSSTDETSFNTLRGRAGFAWDRLFFYGTGGAAFANVGVDVCAPEISGCVSDEQIRTGWVAGGGIEWATWGLPDGSVTLKLEYLHADLGTGLLINPPVTISGETFVSRNVRLTNDIIRVGLNWKFIGW
jgi:opacity protein-like surface antigen